MKLACAAVATICVIIATHHLGPALRVVGLALAVTAIGILVRALAREHDEELIPVAVGGVLTVAGGLGLFGERIDLLPFAVLLVGAAVLVAGLWTMGWARQATTLRPNTGVFVAALLVTAVGVPVLIVAVTGVIMAASDEYTSQYGTPVAVTVSDKCQYFKTQHEKIEGNPDCPGSTWQINGRAVTGDLKVNWTEFENVDTGSTVQAHAIGGKAVAVSHSDKKEDKSAIGSLIKLGRLPSKWLIIAFAAVAMLWTPWVAVELK